MNVFTFCLFGMVLLAAWPSEAGVTAQLDALRCVASTETNIVWQSVRGGIRVTGDHAWRDTGNGIANVVGAEAGPLVFEGEAVSNAFVRTVVMVVRGKSMGEGGLRMRETLICGESIFRLSGRPLNKVEGNETAKVERGGFCEVACWKVNNVPFAPVVAGPQVIEVTFKKDLRLSEVFLGSDGGRGEWRRAWGGGLCEAIFFDSEPSAEALAGVYSLLNLKWKLGLDVPNITPDTLAAARAEGVDFSHFYGTLLILR